MKDASIRLTVNFTIRRLADVNGLTIKAIKLSKSNFFYVKQEQHKFFCQILITTEYNLSMWLDKNTSYKSSILRM